jgi:two-component system sensor histidine kinase YesM
LYVLDNGIGIGEEEKRRIASILERDESPADEADSPIGLFNVHSRIRLICGEGHGIRISSKKGKGTCVIFRLPWKEALEA